MRASVTRIRAVVLALGVAALHVVTEPAVAQPQPGALALYQEGLARYNLAEYDAAIDLFKRAYVVSEAPELLYNIAQAYRLKGAGSCGQALQFYRNYLRVAPTAPKRKSVEAAIADMEKCARTEPTPEPAAVITPAPVAVAPPPLAPAPVRAAPHRSRWPLVLAGAGAVTALAGGGLVLWSVSRYDSLDHSSCAPHCDPSAVDPARTAQTVGYSLVALGGAAAAAGLVLWLGDRAAPDRQAWVRPLGAGAELGFAF